MRFPTRTVVLMILAVLAFFWMYAQTHRTASDPIQVELHRPAEGGDR